MNATATSIDRAILPGPFRPARSFGALEDIRGPLYGYYVAAYTIGRPEGFYGFAKLCRAVPRSVWETPDARAIVSVGPAVNASVALESAFRKVYHRLTERRRKAPVLPLESTLPRPQRRTAA